MKIGSHKSTSNSNTDKKKKELSNSFHFSTLDIIKLNICSNKMKNKNLLIKEKIFNYALDKTFRKLDLLGIIKLFREFDFLKNCYFNEKQINFLNYIKKDEIKYKDISGEDKNELNYNLIKVLDAWDYYNEYSKQEALSNSNMNLLDKRLIENLDGNLKKIFDS